MPISWSPRFISHYLINLNFYWPLSLITYDYNSSFNLQCVSIYIFNYLIVNYNFKNERRSGKTDLCRYVSVPVPHSSVSMTLQQTHKTYIIKTTMLYMFAFVRCLQNENRVATVYKCSRIKNITVVKT